MRVAWIMAGVRFHLQSLQICPDDVRILGNCATDESENCVLCHQFFRIPYDLFHFRGLREKNPMENQITKTNHPDLRERTQLLASRIYEHLSHKRDSLLGKSPIQQLLRCSSAVAANFRSAIQGSSDAEFYSKICLVTEGCDETLFWLDFLARIRVLDDAEIAGIRDEAEDLVKIFTKVRVRFRYRAECLA